MGIDPGPANLGFGIVRVEGSHMVALDGGVVETTSELPIERRLERIHKALAELIAWHEPKAMAIESIYFGKNVRTAMAVNVGTAPIAFLIGGGGLGELIFTGIDLQEYGMMLAGAIPTALLAVAVDFLFGQVQYWLVPRGVNPLRNS